MPLPMAWDSPFSYKKPTEHCGMDQGRPGDTVVVLHKQSTQRASHFSEGNPGSESVFMGFFEGTVARFFWKVSRVESRRPEREWPFLSCLGLYPALATHSLLTRAQ